MTVAQRLNLWYALALLAALLLGGVVVELTSARLASARRTALIEEVRAEVTRAYEAGGVEAASDIEFPGITVKLLDEDGQPIGEDGHPGSDEPSAEDGASDRGLTVRTRLVKGVWLDTVIPEAILQETRRDARLAVAGGGLLVLVLGIGGGLWASRRALAPVRALARAARQAVETGDPAARVASAGTGDELDELVVVLNELLEVDQRRIEQMRASLDHIGHDLRTPMTRIRAAAELALTSRDSEALSEALETAIEEATAAEQLLTRLLDLTRAEAGMMPLDLQAVDPAAVLARVASLYEHVAEERGIQIQLAEASAAPITADQLRLEQALANLVDNALKFSPRGGTVWLAVEPAGAGVRFVVEDEGPGVPEAERERVFDRLVRGDPSRSSPGAGLGLAMVRAIAEAHGGRAELEERAGGGTRALLTLPRRPPERGSGSAAAGYSS